MKIRHRIPPEAWSRPDLISDRYQTEVDASTSAGEKRVRNAMRALDSAERRLSKALKTHGIRSRVRSVLVAREIVELRREELLTIQRLMQAVPASATHRSHQSKRPVPEMRTI